jgi:hypothetical protein
MRSNSGLRREPPHIQRIERDRRTNLVISCIIHGTCCDVVGNDLRVPNGVRPTFIWPLCKGGVCSASLAFRLTFCRTISHSTPCRLHLQDAYLNFPSHFFNKSVKTQQMKYVLSPSTVLCYMFRLLGAIIRQNTIHVFWTIELLHNQCIRVGFFYIYIYNNVKHKISTVTKEKV